MTRTAIEQRLYEEGKADAEAGRPPTPPGGGANLVTAYEEGHAAGTPTPRTPPASDRPSRSSSSTRSKPPRPPANKTRRPARSRSRARRALTGPIARPAMRQTTSALGALGAALLVAVAYNALANADAVGGFLGGIAKALQWLDDPTKSIPYRS